MAEPGERPSKRHRYKLEIISKAEWRAPERVWTSFAEGKTFSSFRQAELYGHEHRPHGHKMRIRKEKIERPATQLDAESTPNPDAEPSVHPDAEPSVHPDAESAPHPMDGARVGDLDALLSAAASVAARLQLTTR